MANENVVEFDVEGLGHFSAYKEPPQKVIFFQKRQQLAKLVGGMTELVEMESRLRRYQKSADEEERKIADSLAIELMTFEGYIDMKTLILKAPDKFNIDSLGEADYSKLFVAFQKARGFFREGSGGKSETPPQASESKPEGANS